jgi:hypothetical protein
MNEQRTWIVDWVYGLPGKKSFSGTSRRIAKTAPEAEAQERESIEKQAPGAWVRCWARPGP